MSSKKPSVGNITEKQETSTTIANIFANVDALNLEVNQCIIAGNWKEASEKTEQAINKCRTVIELDPNCADAYGVLGLLFTFQERYNDAIEAYKIAIEINPEDEDSKRGIANLEEKFNSTKSPSLSSDIIAKAIALKEEGNEFMKSSKFKDAIEKYTEAIALKRDSVFLCNRAAAFCGLKQYEDAKNDCFDAIMIDGNYAKAQARMAFIYSCLGQYFNCATSYMRALQLDPNNENYKENLALARAKLRETNQQP